MGVCEGRVEWEPEPSSQAVRACRHIAGTAGERSQAAGARSLSKRVRAWESSPDAAELAREASSEAMPCAAKKPVLPKWYAQ